MKRTADETTDADGGGKGTTAGLVGGVESVGILALGLPQRDMEIWLTGCP